MGVHLSEKLLLKVSEKVHYLPKSNSLDSYYGDLFLSRPVNSWMNVSAGYRIIESRTTDDDWRTENRPMLSVDLYKKQSNFSFQWYSRLDYRMYKSIDNYCRYKQGVKFQSPKLTPWNLQLFTSEELFVKLNGDGTHMARFYGGVDSAVGSRSKISAFYILQKTKSSGEWGNTDVVGLKFYIAI